MRADTAPGLLLRRSRVRQADKPQQARLPPSTMRIMARNRTRRTRWDCRSAKWARDAYPYGRFVNSLRPPPAAVGKMYFYLTNRASYVER